MQDAQLLLPNFVFKCKMNKMTKTMMREETKSLKLSQNWGKRVAENYKILYTHVKVTTIFGIDYNLEKIFFKISKNLLQLISNGGILYTHIGRKAQSPGVNSQTRDLIFAIKGEQT